MEPLFSEINSYIDEEAKHGRLAWIEDTGWPSQFTRMGSSSRRNSTLLDTVGIIIRSACGKQCNDLLNFLFDILANAVRDEGGWRILFGNHNIVDHCLDVVRAAQTMEFQDSNSWLRNSIRLLTNCCADPDEDGSADDNRAQVVAKIPIPLVINMMNVPAQRTEAVSLIYNIGVFNESFRTMTLSAGLITTIWKTLDDFSQPGSHDLRPLGPVCEILTWTSEADTAASSDPFRSFLRICRYELSYEDVGSLIEASLHILKKEGLPRDETGFGHLLDFMQSTCSLESAAQQSEFSSAVCKRDRFGGEDEEYLAKLRESLIIELSALSGAPDVAQHWTATCPSFATLLDWFQASHFQLRICALTMLGNFAYQSKNLSNSLIKELVLCSRVATLLNSERNGLVLKTALAAIQRFARNVEQRVSFGNSGILATIATSWAQGTNLPLQQAALSTTRLLLSGNLDNIIRFMSEPMPPKGSLLHLLLETFERSEVSESRVDFAWTLERLWRTVYSDLHVGGMYADGDHSGDDIENATTLLQKTIPSVYQSYPKILEPFHVILASGSADQVIASTYTLTIMLNEEKDYDVIYNALCINQGREIFLAVLRNASNPKAQMNARTLVQKLRSHYVEDHLRMANLAGLLQDFEKLNVADD